MFTVCRHFVRDTSSDKIGSGRHFTYISSLERAISKRSNFLSLQITSTEFLLLKYENRYECDPTVANSLLNPADKSLS